jgi:hypothetical protein
MPIVELENPYYRYTREGQLTYDFTCLATKEIIVLPSVLQFHGLIFLGPPLLVPDFVWDRADPAALFDEALVRPSRNTFEAAVAAFGEVIFEFPFCANALPAAALDLVPVDGLDNTLEAAVAALGLVFFVTIFPPSWIHVI